MYTQSAANDFENISLKIRKHSINKRTLNICCKKDEHFLLLQQCLQKSSAAEVAEGFCMLEGAVNDIFCSDYDNSQSNQVNY